MKATYTKEVLQRKFNYHLFTKGVEVMHRSFGSSKYCEGYPVYFSKQAFNQLLMEQESIRYVVNTYFKVNEIDTSIPYGVFC